MKPNNHHSIMNDNGICQCTVKAQDIRNDYFNAFYEVQNQLTFENFTSHIHT